MSGCHQRQEWQLGVLALLGKDVERFLDGVREDAGPVRPLHVHAQNKLAKLQLPRQFGPAIAMAEFIIGDMHQQAAQLGCLIGNEKTHIHLVHLGGVEPVLS